MSNDLSNRSRRRFLARLGIAGGMAALGTGLRVIELAEARTPDEPVTGAQRWGMLVDTAKCTEGCDACVQACNDEHGLTGFGRPTTDAQWIRAVTLREERTGRTLTLPLMCQHCEHPPCVDVCPTGASFRRADGIVLVDKHICIGCRYCMMACPYKARSFVHEDLSNQKPYSPRGKGTVESCTFCVHRVDAEPRREPACVEACGTRGNNALMFGDLNDPGSPIAGALTARQSSAVRADLGLGTGVRYTGL